MLARAASSRLAPWPCCWPPRSPPAPPAKPIPTAEAESQPGRPPPDTASTPTGSAPAEGAVPSADRTSVPIPGPAPELRVPPQHRFQLSSGLSVRLVELHDLPIVSLHLVVDAGAVHDPPRQPGLAAFTAAMLTEGTTRRSATQISDDLGFVGASLGAAAGFDSASLSGAALTAHLDRLLDVFADVVSAPAFPAGDFARVQDQRVVALLQQRDQPGAMAARTFAGAWWGASHPYGHWALGTEASLQAMRREDLRRFHAARWRPQGATLVVVGDVTAADLRPRLERALAGWKGAAPPPLGPTTPRPAATRTVVIPKGGAAPQSYVLMGLPGLPRASPDYAAAEVTFQVLGGGMASRLFRELREKEGYTYGIYARSEERKLGGTSVVVGSVRAEVTGLALAAILRQLEDLRTRPVPEAELSVARNAILLSLPSEFALSSGVAGKVAEEVIYGLPEGYWDRLEDEVRAVTPEDVQRIAQRYLDPERLLTVLVGDPAAVRPQLDGLPVGPVEVLPPARAAPKPRGRRRRRSVGGDAVHSPVKSTCIHSPPM